LHGITLALRLLSAISWNLLETYYQSISNTTISAALLDSSICKKFEYSVYMTKSTYKLYSLFRYGFHKVNKSPRGHRTLAENQIWEFSHSKFLRDRPDLLDDIKRKTMESDTVRRETDLHAHMAMMQVSQSDMLQQINHLYDSFSQIIKELHETKQKQEHHNKLVKNVLSYITQQNGGRLSHIISMCIH